jgi:hypothetical protein
VSRTAIKNLNSLGKSAFCNDTRIPEKASRDLCTQLTKSPDKQVSFLLNFWMHGKIPLQEGADVWICIRQPSATWPRENLGMTAPSVFICLTTGCWQIREQLREGSDLSSARRIQNWLLRYCIWQSWWYFKDWLIQDGHHWSYWGVHITGLTEEAEHWSSWRLTSLASGITGLLEVGHFSGLMYRS